MFDLTVKIVILISLCLVSCKPNLPPPMNNSPIQEDQNPVERIQIVMFESFPVQVNVIVSGHFPDNCTTIDEITETRNNNSFTLNITTVHEQNCAKVIKPFEEIIPLNVEGLKAGVYTVKVNNISDFFELGVDNP